MIYEYSILRYCPDAVRGEFANVGVVVYQGEEKFFKMKVIGYDEFYSRLFPFFGGVGGDYLVRTLEHLRDRVTDMNDEVSSFGNCTLENALPILLPQYEPSLYFTEPAKGTSEDLQRSFEDLYERML